MDWGMISGIIVLIILTISVFVAFKKFKNDKEVEKFIDGLGDMILEITLETINDMSTEGFTDFGEFSKQLIDNIYAATWDYVSYTAEEAVEVNQITKTVFKLINKDTVRNFVNNILEENGVYDKMYNKFALNKIEVLLDNQEPDEVYDSNEYFTEEVVNPEDLQPAGEKQYTEEELKEIANLNPPTDDENEFVDLEDDSVEIMVDHKEIVSQTSKNGQIRYYELDQDGKKTRVTKEYALQHMEA